MKQQKLTAADLAFYLGQKCEVISTEYGHHIYYPGGTGYTIRFDTLAEVHYRGMVIKPILRPLSDLTEDEATKLYTLLFGRGPSRNVLSCLDYFKDESTWTFREITHVIGFTAGWRYLLSIGIDLFGWIDSGLAIDKTKTTPAPEPEKEEQP